MQEGSPCVHALSIVQKIKIRIRYQDQGCCRKQGQGFRAHWQWLKEEGKKKRRIFRDSNCQNSHLHNTRILLNYYLSGPKKKKENEVFKIQSLLTTWIYFFFLFYQNFWILILNVLHTKENIFADKIRNFQQFIILEIQKGIFFLFIFLSNFLFI